MSKIEYSSFQFYRDDTKEDVFIHQKSISKNNPKKAKSSVGEKERVEFDIVLGDRGLEALDVTGLNGEHVVGSIFAAEKKSRKKQSKRQL